MKPTQLLASLVFSGQLLAACVTSPEATDDDDYDDTVYVDEAEAFDEGKADGLERSDVCDPNGELSVNACALLGTIALAEGTHAHYDYTFAYRRFSSFDDHPRLRVCAGSYCSTAAGRYQILSKTWNAIRGNLPDFTPASQDQAALKLIRGRGVTNIDSINTRAELEAAIKKLNREWASLPGSPYGQPRKSMTQLWTEFQRLSGS
jgi:muramidase (phage lysozyme)